MRIAFVMINCNRRDGSARPVNEVSERFVKRGHEVHLFARQVEDLDLTGITWHKVPGPSSPHILKFTSFFKQANKMINLADYDIVHSIGCNTVNANVYTIQNIQPAKMKILQRLRTAEKVSPVRQFTRNLYLNTTCKAEADCYIQKPGKKQPQFLPVSAGVEGELREYYDIGDAPVKIIPNAADLSIFKVLSEQERNEWRTANGLKPEDIVCVFTGGEWVRKGLDFAIRGLGHVPDPRVKLFVAGNDPDLARFQAIAAECNVTDRVIFGGYRKDVAKAFASGDLFLFPSWYEAFSLATIEAAACGLPIIATKINGTEDFIRPGVTGEFVEHDPKDIAAKLIPLTQDTAKRQEMSRAARQLVEEHYTWDRIADQTEAIYNEYLGR